MATEIPAEINIHQLSKSEKQAIAPFLFPEDDKDDENVAPIKHDVQESKPAYVSYKTFDEESPTTTKRKTMYYEDAFAVRGSHNSPKERVARDSVVVVELTTNLKVVKQTEEATYEEVKKASDLASCLRQFYQRPEWAVQVVVQHDADILFDGPGPSYLLKIHALPSAFAPVTNMRNTGLIQKTIHELYGIDPKDGVVLFLPVPEENLATNGSTAQGAIARLESSEMDSPGLIKSISRSMSRRLKSNSGTSAPMSLPSTVVSPTLSTPTDPIHSPIGDAALSEEEEAGPSLKKRESLRTIIHRHMRPKKGSGMKEAKE
ncbi:Tautomerase [Penicillium subrubescens]|uniref:Tautomerase n=1 Tax=Penicillium subrubescens TaxID=1316194 RepID=UPI002544E5A3|nr:Tautomerase [Penicillium subrubescens]KAJ5882992.1 Tautomerase [Penicillium subrubescens]